MQIFIKFFKIFQKPLMSTFVLNVPPGPKFRWRHCSTGLERNSCIKLFSMFPLRTKILAPPLYIYELSLVPPPQFLYVADPMILVIHPINTVQDTVFTVIPYATMHVYFHDYLLCNQFLKQYVLVLKSTY